MKFLKILLAISILFLPACVYDPSSPIQTGNFDGIFNFGDEIENIIVDLRREDEYLKGHRGLAINIPSMDAKRGQFDLRGYEDCKIILYGNYEKDGEDLVGLFQDLGFEEVVVDPGIKEATYSLVEYRSILAKDFEKILNDDRARRDVFIIDTRQEEDYDQGHVRGAVNIKGENFADKLGSIPRSSPIIVYGYDDNDEFARTLTEYRDQVNFLIEGTEMYDYQEFYNFNN